MSTLNLKAPPAMFLDAMTAEDLMTPNPISIHAGASAQEAVAMLTDRGFSAAPVIDEAGRPVGVLSRTDLLVHELENAARAPASAEYYARHELKTAPSSAQVSEEPQEAVDRA